MTERTKLCTFVLINNIFGKKWGVKGKIKNIKEQNWNTNRLFISSVT